VAPGLVHQCARLVDAVRARAGDRATNIVVVSTPVATAYAAQTAIHVSRLLAASEGASVVLVDATGGDPQLPELLHSDVGPEDVDAASPPDVSLDDLPLIQLVVLDVDHRALAGRLRAVADDAGVRWIVAHAPAFADMPDEASLHAMVRVGEGLILVVPAATPTPVIGDAIAAVGRDRLVGTVLVGIDGL
jgi:hypothetical protein